MLSECSCSPSALYKSHNELGYSFDKKCSTKQKLQPNHLQKVVWCFCQRALASQKYPAIKIEAVICLSGCVFVLLSEVKREKFYICHLNLAKLTKWLKDCSKELINSVIPDQFCDISYRIYLEKYYGDFFFMGNSHKNNSCNSDSVFKYIYIRKVTSTRSALFTIDKFSKWKRF